MMDNRFFILLGLLLWITSGFAYNPGSDIPFLNKPGSASPFILQFPCGVVIGCEDFVNLNNTGCCDPGLEQHAWEEDGDGYCIHTQEIKVINNEVPEWINCEDLTICNDQLDCSPVFVNLIGEAIDWCTPQAPLQYSYQIDIFNDGTVDITDTGNDASGDYPLGTHKITYEVTDQCGNGNTCTKYFTIRDCKKPTPICINGLIVDLMPMEGGGMAEIWATSLEAGDSHDNCLNYDDLEVLIERFSDLTPGQEVPGAGASDVLQVTCDDMPPGSSMPIVEVVVWVGDEAGNWDYCITTVSIQDNMGCCVSCPGGNTLMVTTYDETKECIGGVDVYLSGYINMYKPASDCVAMFSELEPNNIVSVTPMKDMNPLNGVTSYDLLLIQKHILGVKKLYSPYKIISADVNKSSSVTISDIIELRKMILSPGLNFSNNTSWRFVEEGYVFDTPNQPFDFPETHSLLLLPNMNTINFIGMKIGDVSGDHSPNNLMGGETRNSVGTLSFEVADKQLVKGETHTVEILSNGFEGIQGYQYTLDFDHSMLNFVNVDTKWTDLSTANFGLDRVSGGTLTTSWNSSAPASLPDGEVLYTVTFLAKADLKLSDVMKINSKVTLAEGYDANEDQLNVNLRFKGNLLTEGEFALFQNEPNPFRDITVIGFNLPASTRATLTVYDMAGKVLHEVSGDYSKGYNAIHLNRADIRGNGMLYYSLETTTDKATRRMILID